MASIGIFSRNPASWASQRLCEAIRYYGYTPMFLKISRLLNRVGYGSPRVEVKGVDLEELLAVIVRPIGKCSLEEAIFRMDTLHRLVRLGKVVVNPPSAIEKCLDKFYSLFLLEESGLPVPRTAVAENVLDAMRAFHELGGDVVVKPIFGSRGIGTTRVSDPEVAFRVFSAIQFIHGVIYLQEFIPHGNRDIRVFVIGDRVVAAMYREASTWKTNVSQGARPRPLEPSEELKELALKASEVVGCEVAGVDLLESGDGYYITEINSQPGWKGLQQVTRVNIAREIVKYVISKTKA